jgi:hypothetical protein
MPRTLAVLCAISFEIETLPGPTIPTVQLNSCCISLLDRRIEL